MSKNLCAPRAKPVGENFLVVQDEGESHTTSGLYIPQAAVEKQKSGTVVAVGDRVPDSVKIGTRLMWLYTIASEVKVDDVAYLVMNISDVAVILPEKVAVREAA